MLRLRAVSKTRGAILSDITATVDSRNSKGRSAVTNGKRLFPGVDGRTREARRYRDVLDSLIVEYDAIAESDLGMCRRIAGLTVFCERIEAQLARGESADDGALVTAGNSIRRFRRDLAASRRTRQRTQRVSA
jgi:hypothetical protein